MKKHFVTFYSPGTLVSETTTKPIDSWDTDRAMEMAHEIKERHGATPYGFQFSTRERDDGDLDSHETARSQTYYLGGRIETLAEVEARNDPEEKILRSNMRGNGCDRIVVNENSWRMTRPFHADDVVLDWTPRAEAT